MFKSCFSLLGSLKRVCVAKLILCNSTCFGGTSVLVSSKATMSSKKAAVQKKGASLAQKGEQHPSGLAIPKISSPKGRSTRQWASIQQAPQTDTAPEGARSKQRALAVG